MTTTILNSAGRSLCLGRVKPRTRRATLHLGDFVDGDVSAYPPTCDYAAPVPTVIKQWFLNDKWGDCVIADLMRSIGVATGVESKAPVIATDAETLATYRRLKAGPGDSGCIITDVLDAMVQGGVTVSGQLFKYAGYVAVDWRSKGLLMAALLDFGGVRVGLDLPEDWANTEDGDEWKPTSSRVVGGHDVRIVKYDADGVWVATWGGLRFLRYATAADSGFIDEAYVEALPAWTARADRSPTNLASADLARYLAMIGAGTLPPMVALPSIDLGDWA